MYCSGEMARNTVKLIRFPAPQVLVIYLEDVIGKAQQLEYRNSEVNLPGTYQSALCK